MWRYRSAQVVRVCLSEGEREDSRRGRDDPRPIPIEGRDHVIHLAAQTGIEKTIEFPEQTWETNAKGTPNVFESAREADIEKFLFGQHVECLGCPGVPAHRRDAPA